MDTNCLQLQFWDGSRIIIDCSLVETAYADHMYEHSKLDYLIYNDPEAYAEFILAGEPANHLSAITEYKLFEQPSPARSDQNNLLVLAGFFHFWQKHINDVAFCFTETAC